MENEIPVSAWAFDIVLGLLITIVGFFVKQLVSDRNRDNQHLQELSHRIAVLEERNRKDAEVVDEIKACVHELRTDIQWIREQLAVIVAERLDDVTGEVLGPRPRRRR